VKDRDRARQLQAHNNGLGRLFCEDVQFNPEPSLRSHSLQGHARKTTSIAVNTCLHANFESTEMCRDEFRPEQQAKTVITVNRSAGWIGKI
jgi:hypothetical protein